MENTDQVLAVWRARGFRLTKTRKAFARLFSLSLTPVSASEILSEFEKMRQPVNKTTVYRELERMQALGILKGVRLGDRTQYYELALRDHHHHLVCVRCENIEDVDVDETALKQAAEASCREKSFSVTHHALEFFGICMKCQAAG